MSAIEQIYDEMLVHIELSNDHMLSIDRDI